MDCSAAAVGKKVVERAWRCAALALPLAFIAHWRLQTDVSVCAVLPCRLEESFANFALFSQRAPHLPLNPPFKLLLL